MQATGKEWSLLAGFLAGRRGRPLQPGMGADWRHGWALGRRRAVVERRQHARGSGCPMPAAAQHWPSSGQGSEAP